MDDIVGVVTWLDVQNTLTRLGEVLSHAPSEPTVATPPHEAINTSASTLKTGVNPKIDPVKMKQVMESWYILPSVRISQYLFSQFGNFPSSPTRKHCGRKSVV